MRRKNKTRSDGLIPVEVYLGRNSKTGKRIRRTVYGKTQKEADAKAEALKLKYNKGIDVSGNDTFGDWAARWLASKHCSPGRLKICQYSIDKLSSLSPMSLEKVHPADVQTVIDKYAKCNPVTGAPSARKTLLDLRNVAHQIFQLAVDNRVTDWNPVDVVKVPSDAPETTREPVDVKIIVLIETTRHRAQTAAMIMLYAGLRRGELLALEWRNVDLEKGCIHVEQSVEMYSGKANIKDGGKTQCARRTVYIPARLVDYLTPIRERHVIPLQGRDLVFPARKGGPYGSASWTRLWKSYMKTLSEAAEEPISFTAHQLRHTFATSLYLAGVDPKTAQDQLGHAELETTMEIYTHLDREFKRRSMDKLDRFYSGSIPVGGSKKSLDNA